MMRLTPASAASYPQPHRGHRRAIEIEMAMSVYEVHRFDLLFADALDYGLAAGSHCQRSASRRMVAQARNGMK